MSLKNKGIMTTLLGTALAAGINGCDSEHTVTVKGGLDGKPTEKVDEKCSIISNGQEIFYVKKDVGYTCQEVRDEITYYVEGLSDDVNYTKIINDINKDGNVGNIQMVDDNITKDTPKIELLHNEYIIETIEDNNITLLEGETFDIYAYINNNFSKINSPKVNVSNNGNKINIALFYETDGKPHKIEQKIILNEIPEDELTKILEEIFNDTKGDPQVDCNIDIPENNENIKGQSMTSIELKENVLKSLNLNSVFDFEKKPTGNIEIYTIDSNPIFKDGNFLISEDELYTIQLKDIEFIFGQGKITFSTSDGINHTLYNY